MKKKDLAGEYLTKAQENAIYFKDGKFPNMPELEWKGYAPFIHASTPIGRYNIDDFGIYLLRFNGKEIPLPTGSSLEEAKLAANEDYKKRIKQALGL